MSGTPRNTMGSRGKQGKPRRTKKRIARKMKPDCMTQTKLTSFMNSPKASLKKKDHTPSPLKQAQLNVKHGNLEAGKQWKTDTFLGDFVQMRCAATVSQSPRTPHSRGAQGCKKVADANLARKLLDKLSTPQQTAERRSKTSEVAATQVSERRAPRPHRRDLPASAVGKSRSTQSSVRGKKKQGAASNNEKKQSEAPSGSEKVRATGMEGSIGESRSKASRVAATQVSERRAPRPHHRDLPASAVGKSQSTQPVKKKQGAASNNEKKQSETPSGSEKARATGMEGSTGEGRSKASPAPEVGKSQSTQEKVPSARGKKKQEAASKEVAGNEKKQSETFSGTSTEKVRATGMEGSTGEAKYTFPKKDDERVKPAMAVKVKASAKATKSKVVEVAEEEEEVDFLQTELHIHVDGAEVAATIIKQLEDGLWQAKVHNDERLVTVHAEDVAEALKAEQLARIVTGMGTGSCTLVWATAPPFPAWPALCLPDEVVIKGKKCHTVVYLGTYDSAELPSRQIAPLTVQSRKFKSAPQDSPELNSAMYDATMFAEHGQLPPSLATMINALDSSRDNWDRKRKHSGNGEPPSKRARLGDDNQVTIRALELINPHCKESNPSLKLPGLFHAGMSDYLESVCDSDAPADACFSVSAMYLRTGCFPRAALCRHLIGVVENATTAQGYASACEVLATLHDWLPSNFPRLLFRPAAKTTWGETAWDGFRRMLWFAAEGPNVCAEDARREGYTAIQQRKASFDLLDGDPEPTAAETHASCRALTILFAKLFLLEANNNEANATIANGGPRHHQLGKQVIKFFNGVPHRGEVVAVGKYVHVRYEDEDSEDMSDEEFETTMVASRRKTTSFCDVLLAYGNVRLARNEVLGLVASMTRLDDMDLLLAAQVFVDLCIHEDDDPRKRADATQVLACELTRLPLEKQLLFLQTMTNAENCAMVSDVMLQRTSGLHGIARCDQHLGLQKLSMDKVLRYLFKLTPPSEPLEQEVHVECLQRVLSHVLTSTGVSQEVKEVVACNVKELGSKLHPALRVKVLLLVRMANA